MPHHRGMAQKLKGANTGLTPHMTFRVFISLVRQDPRVGEVALGLRQPTSPEVLLWVSQTRHFQGL